MCPGDSSCLASLRIIILRFFLDNFPALNLYSKSTNFFTEFTDEVLCTPQLFLSFVFSLHFLTMYSINIQSL